MTRQTIGLALFLALVCSANGFAQGRTTVDPYTTNLGVRYDFFSHSGDANSFVGFNADVTRMLGGFTNGGGWGAGGGVEFEKFDSATLKEFEGYVTAQAVAIGKKQMSPFGRFGIGINTDEGFTDMLIDFRGGVDFKWKPDANYLISVMASVKRVLADVQGFTVFRLSAGVVIPLAK